MGLLIGQFKGVVHKPSNMTNLLVFIFLGSLAGLVVGLIKPGLMLPPWPSREMVSCVYGGVAIASFVLIALIAPQPPQAPPQQEAIAPSPVATASATPPVRQGDPIEKLMAIADGQPGEQSVYTALLDKLDPVCLQERNEVGNLAMETAGVATAGGVETTSLEALQALEKATADLTSGEVDCEELFNAMLKVMGVE